MSTPSLHPTTEQCSRDSSAGIARRGDETGQDRARINTNYFVHGTCKQRHASSARRLKKHNVPVLILSQSCCLEMDRGFRFLKKEKAAKFTTLEKKIK